MNLNLPKFLNTQKEIEEKLLELCPTLKRTGEEGNWGSKRFEILKDGTVNILGDFIDYKKREFDHTPIKFGYVKGDFIVNWKLKTTEGLPLYVSGKIR